MRFNSVAEPSDFLESSTSTRVAWSQGFDLTIVLAVSVSRISTNLLSRDVETLSPRVRMLDVGGAPI